MNYCIPFTQSWYSLSAWKMAVAARQVKQIWFHSYLVTVRFSFSCTACNRICHVLLGLRRNLLPSRARDGRREPWLTVPGGGSVGSKLISSLLERERGRNGLREGVKEIGKRKGRSISQPRVSFFLYERNFPFFPSFLSFAWRVGPQHPNHTHWEIKRIYIYIERLILQTVLAGQRIQSYTQCVLNFS